MIYENSAVAFIDVLFFFNNIYFSVFSKCYFHFQFTLNVTLKGNKPDFHEAMGPDLSQQMYGELLKQLGAAYDPDKIKGREYYIKVQNRISVLQHSVMGT